MREEDALAGAEDTCFAWRLARGKELRGVWLKALPAARADSGSSPAEH